MLPALQRCLGGQAADRSESQCSQKPVPPQLTQMCSTNQTPCFVLSELRGEGRGKTSFRVSELSKFTLKLALPHLSLWEPLNEGSGGMDWSLPCIYPLALAFRRTSPPSDVLLRPVPALLLRSPAAGHQLQPALLPPLWGLHRHHPAPHRHGHPARAHPQLLPAKHNSGVHGVSSGGELPAVLRGPRVLWGSPGAGEGGTAVPGQRAVGVSPAVTSSHRCQQISRIGRSTRPRLGKRTKEMPMGFPAAGAPAALPGGRDPCEVVSHDRVSVYLSLTKPYFIFPRRCHTLQCCTAFAAGWAKTLIAGCRQKMIVTGWWGRGTPCRD